MTLPINSCRNDSCGCSTREGKDTVAAYNLAPPSATDEKTVLRIEQMDCPTEEALIRDKLAAITGIHALAFNLLQCRPILSHARQRAPLLPIGRIHHAP
jgi:Cd2+/Zn2+-exporting ATPase